MPMKSDGKRLPLGYLSVRFWFSLYIALTVFLAFALLSVAVRHAISIHIGPIYLDGNGEGASELRDRILYVPFYSLGAIAVFAANWRVPSDRMPSPRIAVSLLAIIFLIHVGLSLKNWFPQVLCLCVALAGVVRALGWRPGQHQSAPAVPLPVLRASWLDALAIVAICILLLPASADRLAAHLGFNIGKISDIVGPALYGYGEHLAPGPDFYSHYGPGLGPVFSHFMGVGWKGIATNAVELIVASTALFYCAMYVLLLFLTRSRLLAFAASVFTALLNFSTYFPFDAPSAYPIRYPFLIPFVLAFGWLCGGQRRLAPVIAMAIFAGLSLFWHTEIGLYLVLAGCGGIFVARGIRPSEFATFGIFLVGTLAAFFAVAWLFIGGPALSWSFLTDAMKPIAAYSAGWDGVPVKWNTIWSLFYNIPLQAVAIVTVGGFWFLMWFRYDSLTVRERQVGGVLSMLSLVGLAMLAKWINRSLDAEWHQNAIPLIIVICWWGHFLWINSRAPAALARAGRAMRVSAVAGPLMAAIAFLLLVDDSANPAPYGLRSYIAYPSIAKSIVAPAKLYNLSLDSRQGYFIDWDWPELLTRISSDDIALIQRNAKPHERVAVISVVDWAYLAQAQRPPKAVFVPVEWSYDKAFIDRSFDGAEAIFVDDRFLSRKDPPAFAILANLINRNYAPAEHSTTLTLYRLKKPAEPSRPESLAQ